VSASIHLIALWGPHHKLESRPNLPFNGLSNGLFDLAQARHDGSGDAKSQSFRRLV
jgi:hypothetical protein